MKVLFRTSVRKINDPCVSDCSQASCSGTFADEPDHVEVQAADGEPLQRGHQEGGPPQGLRPRAVHVQGMTSPILI